MAQISAPYCESLANFKDAILNVQYGLNAPVSMTTFNRFEYDCKEGVVGSTIDTADRCKVLR